MKNIVALGLLTAMLALGQVLFKCVGRSVSGRPPAGALTMALAEPTLYAAFAVYAAATLLWIWILGREPLSRAYPWIAAGTLIVVPILGWLFFSERPPGVFWAGVLLIICGLALTQIGGRSF